MKHKRVKKQRTAQDTKEQLAFIREKARSSQSAAKAVTQTLLNMSKFPGVFARINNEYNRLPDSVQEAIMRITREPMSSTGAVRVVNMMDFPALFAKLEAVRQGLTDSILDQIEAIELEPMDENDEAAISSLIEPERSASCV